MRSSHCPLHTQPQHGVPRLHTITEATSDLDPIGRKQPIPGWYTPRKLHTGACSQRGDGPNAGLNIEISGTPRSAKSSPEMPRTSGRRPSSLVITPAASQRISNRCEGSRRSDQDKRADHISSSTSMPPPQLPELDAPATGVGFLALLFLVGGASRLTSVLDACSRIVSQGDAAYDGCDKIWGRRVDSSLLRGERRLRSAHEAQTRRPRHKHQPRSDLTAKSDRASRR